MRLTPRNTLLPHVTTPRLLTLGQTIWALAGCPKKFEDAGAPSLGREHSDPLNHASPHLSYHDNFGHSGSNRMSVLWRSAKNVIAYIPPFKVTGTDTDQLAMYNLLLVIYSNHGPILHSLQDKWRFPLQLPRCHHPLSLPEELIPP